MTIARDESPPQGRLRPALVALVGLLAVLASGYAAVRPTNFSGWDEWLVIDLTSRGTIALPFENRPLSLLFNLPGSLLSANGLWGFWLVHACYLWAAGACVYFLARRVAPGRERLAFLAAVLAATWAPRDSMRLDPVLLSNYSGAAAATLVGCLLLVEAHVSRRAWLVLVAGALGFTAVRALESTAGLVLAAPALLWLLPGRPAKDGRRRVRSAAIWLAMTLPALALAAKPLLPGQPAAYQLAGLGLDPAPQRVAARLLLQLRDQLVPSFALPWPDALLPALLAAGFFSSVLLLLRRHEPARVEGGGQLRLLVLGAGAVVLGQAVLVLSPAMRSPQRMQILSAPGAGLLLAAAFAVVGEALGGRAAPRALALLGAAAVALGAARTVALQREWDERSLWPAQRATLASLTRVAEGFRPGTLVLLLDRGRHWPASFTFRHALRYLYGRAVAGAVWDAEPFLYPLQFTPEGFVSTPYESIRIPWQAPVTVHPFSSVVVVRALDDGTVEWVDRWPLESLPPLPPGATYAPRLRILPVGYRPERRAILAAGGHGPWTAWDRIRP